MTTVVCVLYICPLSSRVVDCHLSPECVCQLEEEFGRRWFYRVSQLIVNVTAVDMSHTSTLCQQRPTCQLLLTCPLKLMTTLLARVVNTTGQQRLPRRRNTFIDVLHCSNDVSRLRQTCLFTSVPRWKYTVNIHHND